VEETKHIHAQLEHEEIIPKEETDRVAFGEHGMLPHAETSQEVFRGCQFYREDVGLQI
jgi:hypothetical protein